MPPDPAHSQPPPAAGLALSEEERELLLPEVREAADRVAHPDARATYASLLAAVDLGEVPEELLDALASLLEIGLESGRIRAVHTAHGEMAASRLYARTPRGRALREAAEAVNAALRAAVGGTLHEVRIDSGGPGRYSLTLATEAGTFLIRFDRRGVRIQSVEVG